MRHFQVTQKLRVSWNCRFSQNCLALRHVGNQVGCKLSQRLNIQDVYLQKGPLYSVPPRLGHVPSDNQGSQLALVGGCTLDLPGKFLLGWLLQAQAEGGGTGAKEGGLPSIVGSNRPREERDSEAGQQQHSHQLAGQGNSWLAHGRGGGLSGCACLLQQQQRTS